MTFLETADLAAGYRHQLVLQGLSLSVMKGQVIGVLGPNGSGKTTLLRTLAGLLAPLHGTVWLEGTDLTGLAPAALAQRRAILPAVTATPGLLTAFEVAALGRYPYTGHLGRLTSHDRRITEESLGLVDALDLADRYFHQLSDGEKQRILLARALAQEPDLLILDEPTNYLDLRHRLELMLVFTRLSRQQGITIILAHHQPDLAVKSCDLVLLIKQQRLLGAGPPEQVITTAAVQELYELRSGVYSHLLGGVELPVPQPARVFVIAGNGTGTAIYRLLVKAGRGFATGIIHQNDLDYHVAQAIGAKILSTAAFEPISAPLYTSALASLDQYQAIIDSGFPVGSVNRNNLKLAQQALQQGKCLISLRPKAEAAILFGPASRQISYCPNLTDLPSHLT